MVEKTGFVGVNLAGSTLLTAKVVELYTTDTPVAASPKKPVNESNGMVLWGSDNLWPQGALEKIKANPGLSSGMNHLTNCFSSFRIRYGILKGYKDDGTPEYDRTMIPEVEDCFRVNNPTNYLLDFASEAFRLWNPVVSYYKTLNGKKIGRFVMERTKDCRFAPMDKNGQINTVFINSNWKDGATPKSKTTITRKLMDRYMDTTTFLTENKDDVISQMLLMPETGDDYYQEPPWYSFVNSGWYEIAQNIPRIKKARMKNMASPAWILYIPISYFEKRYAGKWAKNPDEDKRIVASEVEDWKKCCLGVDNQGKMITNLFFQDPSGKDYAKWELKKLELNDGGEFLEDSYESYSMLYRALGFDGSLIGNIPAKTGQGNSGGSDKREGTNVLMTSLLAISEIALQPFNVYRDFNQLNPMLRFWVDIPYMPSKNEIATKDRTPTTNSN